MICMGLDASTTATGWSIFEDDKLIDYGVIKPEGEDWRDRLCHEGTFLVDIIEKYRPEKVYMEDVPRKKSNATALIILGAVQGYVLGIVSKEKVPVVFLQPSAWRSVIGIYDGTKEGTKRAVLKEKAIIMANKIFGLKLEWHGPSSKKSNDDQAEAILICYSQVKKKRFGK